jgi:hypothetical protein
VKKIVLRETWIEPSDTFTTVSAVKTPKAHEKDREAMQWARWVQGDRKKKKSNAWDIHSWTHEKETSNALLYMGIVENADPHPSDTFEVTLRGEKAIQALDAEK